MADDDDEIPRVIVERTSGVEDSFDDSATWSLSGAGGIVVFDVEGDAIAEYAPGTWTRVWTSYD